MRKKSYFEKGKKIHMVGIAGIGMSALSAFLVDRGCKVTGSDISESIDIPKKVKFLGTHHAQHVTKSTDCVIISHAIPLDNVEVKKAQELGIELLTYPEAVGKLTEGYQLISVAGTHGKSTTTSMLAKILIDAGHDPNVIVGTRVPDMDGRNFRIGKSNIFLLESCEYKEAFLHYKPTYLVLTNIEPDHLDFYKTRQNYLDAFQKYLGNVRKGGVVLFNGDDEGCLDVIEGYRGDTEVVSLKNLEALDLKIIGRHNQYNAWQAIKTAKQLGVDEEVSKGILAEFEGTWRRMEYKGEYKGAKIYDDYGHHPTEIAVTLAALRHAYPHKRIVCVFQPHQYSRTVCFFDEFVEALQDAYFVIIPNIYKVRDTEEDVSQVDGEDLVDAINAYEEIERAVYGDGFESTLQLLKPVLDEHSVCVVMGAGNVTDICDMLLS